MKAEKQQQRSWKISVHAKSKNFNFRLKATKISPTRKIIHRFSILLKLHKFLLRLKSESATPPFPTTIQQQQQQQQQQRRRTLRSRFIGAVEKLRPHRAKKQPAASVTAKEKSPKLPHPEVKSSLNHRFKHFVYEEPVLGCCLVIGILAFLFQSVFDKGHRGINILGLVILLCTVVTSINNSKNMITEKSRTVLTFSVVATTVGALSVLFGFDQSVTVMSELIISCLNQIFYSR